MLCSSYSLLLILSVLERFKISDAVHNPFFMHIRVFATLVEMEYNFIHFEKQIITSIGQFHMTRRHKSTTGGQTTLEW